MSTSRILVTTFAAAGLALVGGCTSTPDSTVAQPLVSADQRPAKASMVATDGIGAAVFADDTAIAGNFRPYAGRLDGPERAAFAQQAGTALANVETD